MQFKIYQFELKHRHLPTKQGFLLEDSFGNWSEISPLENRNKESLEDVLLQLQAINRGWQGPLLPSVAFGIYGLTAACPEPTACALFLYGTSQEVMKDAQASYGCSTAKIKVGLWTVDETLEVIQALSPHFRLRLDFNQMWHPSQVHRLCSYLSPDQIEFLEDPGCSVDSFSVAYDANPSSSPMTIWKPMVRGLPPSHQPLILSSSLESSMGLRQVASLIQSHQIPHHNLGIGTVTHIEDDLVANPAYLKDGKLHFPPRWEIKYDRLSLRPLM